MDKFQLEILKETDRFSFDSVLDIGLGGGLASKYFLSKGKKVTATGFDIKSYTPQKEIIDNLNLFEEVDVEDMSCFKKESFDAVWCAHVIEHSQNFGNALKEIHRVLKPNGYLFLIVPPYFPYVVGGHTTLGWNLGALMYNLILTGFNVQKGSFFRHRWNLIAFVRKDKKLEIKLRHDGGDVTKLKDYFPLKICEGFNGDLKQVNWEWTHSNKSVFRRMKDIFIENLVFLKKDISRIIIKLKQDILYVTKSKSNF